MGTKKGHGNDQYAADGLRARLHEIAYRDSAASVTVRADDLRAILAALPLPHEAAPAAGRAASTPEAPGIDQAIAAVESIQQYMRDDFQALPPKVFSLPPKAQRALVTLRGLADAPMRVYPRDAKEAVDYVVAHMLADSPQGGREAADFTADEVNQVIDAALQRGTRLIPAESIEQMRTVLLARAQDDDAEVSNA